MTFRTTQEKQITYRLEVGRFAIPIHKIRWWKENRGRFDLGAETHRGASLAFTFLRSDSDQCSQVTTRRSSSNANPFRIDPIVGGMLFNITNASLNVGPHFKPRITGA